MNSNDTPLDWNRDGCDRQWWTNKRGDAVRGQKSYRSGGWWLLRADLPDTEEHDIGPFRTRAAAMDAASRTK